ncbi:hypothetical protein DTL42_18250 [Bremerella cremea]|uniref:Glycosyl transferase n=1 Tax=Bremerella cremea TaxID=1031537 RepID=A0A368KMP6_9BACT|nr:glycosyltransferase [Bremerella cremea]RCS43928.1 hypothetical protein DTL42_18250 [Bremerella cremea]
MTTHHEKNYAAKVFHARPSGCLPQPEGAVPSPQPSDRIAKRMHFVWLGAADLPLRDAMYVETFRQFHPQWEVRVWRDDDVFALPITGQLCRNLRPLAAAADVARVEIVHQLGGWYSDTDVRWLKSIDYLASLPLVLSTESDRRAQSLANGIFAAPAKHPLLEVVLKRLAALSPGTIAANDVLNETGPKLWTRALRNFAPQARLHHSYNQAMGGLVVDVETSEVIAHHNLSFRWL